MTPQQQTALAARLQESDVAGLSDAAAAKLLWTAPVSAYQMVDTRTISTFLIHSGELASIGAKALIPADGAFAVCYVATEYIRTHEQLSLDPATSDGSKARELLAALVSANLLSEASQTAILAMAAAETTWAAAHGFINRLILQQAITQIRGV
jgi:hypothetical protein